MAGYMLSASKDTQVSQFYSFLHFHLGEWDKDNAYNFYMKNMINKVLTMFEYEGLPDTITVRNLELLNIVNGCSTWASVDGKLYAFRGGLGGQPDPYYMPTLSIVANPALKLSKVYTIDKDCVVMPNDDLYVGLLPLMEHYAHLITECDTSIRVISLVARQPQVLTANTDSAFKGVQEWLKTLEDGKLAAVMGSVLADNIKAVPYGINLTNVLSQLEEIRQYYLGHWYLDLGIKSAFNMKREALNAEETAMSDDTTIPLITDMLNKRKEALEKINKMFGTNISVKLSSVWSAPHDAQKWEGEVLKQAITDNITEQATKQEEEETEDKPPKAEDKKESSDKE